MSNVSELERAIEKLPEREFQILAAWVEQRSRKLNSHLAGTSRDHSAFLSSYAPEDEGLYDDATR
jgi:hypothetical protein